MSVRIQNSCHNWLKTKQWHIPLTNVVETALLKSTLFSQYHRLWLSFLVKRLTVMLSVYSSGHEQLYCDVSNKSPPYLQLLFMNKIVSRVENVHMVGACPFVVHLNETPTFSTTVYSFGTIVISAHASIDCR